MADVLCSSLVLSALLWWQFCALWLSGQRLRSATILVQVLWCAALYKASSDEPRLMALSRLHALSERLLDIVCHFLSHASCRHNACAAEANSASLVHISQGVCFWDTFLAGRHLCVANHDGDQTRPDHLACSVQSSGTAVVMNGYAKCSSLTSGEPARCQKMPR